MTMSPDSTELDLSYFGQSGRRNELVFSSDAGGRTFLSRQSVSYPFHICRPMYVEQDPPGMATLYVQSTGAGLLQHDDLYTKVSVEAGAQVHLTTGAQTIVHSMDEGHASQMMDVEVAEDGFIEYVPEPLILFPDSRLRSVTHITAHERARVISVDAFLPHDYTGGEGIFEWFEGELLVLRPDGRLVAHDRFHFNGNVLREQLPGVNREFMMQASVIALDPEMACESLVSTLRTTLDGVPGIYAGTTGLRGGAGTWTRLLACDGVALRAGLNKAWQAAHEHLTAMKAVPRRR